MNETFSLSPTNLVMRGVNGIDKLLIMKNNYIIKSKKNLFHLDKFFKNNKWVSW